MKKIIDEIDYIGGQGSLSNEEESALTKYFSAQKNKTVVNESNKPTEIYRKKQTTTS